MANKAAIEFFLYINGDGTSTTLIVDLNTAPTCFLGPAGSPLSPNFSLGSLTLSGFAELACSSGQTVTATHLLNVVTFTLSAAITSGDTSYIYGKLLF
jgi:hypothetical protein